jgi:cytochrome bd-type quinol oxidase subunit 2
MVKFIQKRLDLVLLIISSYYIHSNYGDKPQVAALFTALKYLLIIYLLKNSIYPSKDFFKKWVTTLKVYDFETSPETLRLVTCFLTFALIVYSFVEKIYLTAK